MMLHYNIVCNVNYTYNHETDILILVVVVYYAVLFAMLYYVRTITVGKTLIGSDYPVAKQTMTTTNTRDVDASVQQVQDCIWNNSRYIL